MEIELQHVLRAFRRWGWALLVLVALGGVIAFVLSSIHSPSYSATTSLLVTPPTSTTIVENENRAQTYRLLVESGPVLDRVNAELDLPYDRQELASNIEASVIPNSQLIEIAVTDESPQRAADIANSIARNFESQVADLTVGQLERNLETLEREAEQLRTRQAEIVDQLHGADAEQDLDDTAVQAETASLEVERLRVSQTIADLDASIRIINEQLATSTTPVAVADVAQPPIDSDGPGAVLLSALGAFLGGIVGIGSVALLTITDNKVRRETDVELLTGSRLLGAIPNDKDAERRRTPYVLSHPSAPATEAVRRLRSRLGKVAHEDAHSALVVTSVDDTSQSGSVATNLALAMTESGLNTVLIDADFRTPSVQDAFSISNATGLSTILQRPTEAWDSIAVQAGGNRLLVIPTGPVPQNSSTILSTGRLTYEWSKPARSANLL